MLYSLVKLLSTVDRMKYSCFCSQEKNFFHDKMKFIIDLCFTDKTGYALHWNLKTERYRLTVLLSLNAFKRPERLPGRYLCGLQESS